MNDLCVKRQILDSKDNDGNSPTRRELTLVVKVAQNKTLEAKHLP